MSEAATELTREELHRLVWQTPMSRLAERFGISGNGLAKICRRLDVPYPPRGWWAKKEAGKAVVTAQLPAARSGTPSQVAISATPDDEDGLKAAIRHKRAELGEISVLQRLARPHPLIARWIEEHRRRLEEARRERDPRRRSLWAIADFSETERRRHRVLHALFRALEQHGATISQTERSEPLATISGERIEFSLSEKSRQATRPMTAKEMEWESWNKSGVKTELEPTGYLHFSIKAWIGQPFRKNWLEGERRPIDAMLPEIAATFLVLGPLLAERTRLREERARQFAEEQRSRELEEQRRRQDENRWRRFLEITKGRQCCPRCKRPYDTEKQMLALEAIEVYLAAATAKASWEAIEYRLKHIVAYIAALTSPSVLCQEIDEAWIAKFRAWSEKLPVANSKDGRQRALSTVENSVIQLAAAFRHVKEEPRFKPLQPKDLNRTPRFRAKVTHLVEMFRYCLHPEGPTVRSDKERARRIRERQHILAFLRVSVFTLARPDAAHDISTEPSRGQWDSEQGVLDLNPRGRRQTKKYRPIVPIARQGSWLFDETKGFIVNTGSSRKGFYTMTQELGLPGDRESGMKLIRRSMADLIRARLVAAGRSEDELSVFLGHRKINSVSELYAPFNPGYLNNVRTVIEEIADEIEAGCQGAFSPQKHRTE